MTYYDDIYEYAVDNHYLITSKEAADMGIPNIELVKLAQRGRLEHISQGLYRLSRYVPSDADTYAIAVAKVGENAYLYGESVIGMLDLAPTNPAYICVATPRRIRRSLPDSIRVVKVPGGEYTFYDGVRSQRVGDAILSCKATMMPERLHEAIKKARQQGYITSSDCNELKEAVK